jgi:hypothetical protein
VAAQQLQRKKVVREMAQVVGAQEPLGQLIPAVVAVVVVAQMDYKVGITVGRALLLFLYLLLITLESLRARQIYLQTGQIQL